MFKVKKQGFSQGAMTLAAGRCLQVVLGFVHFMVVINTFGGAGLTDAYFLAYSLFILATTITLQSLTFTFVPVFTEWRKHHGEAAAWDMASTVLNLSLVILSALSALVWWLAPQIARLVGPGLAAEPAHMATLTALIRILSPAILFSALGGIPRSLYASYQSFVLPALTAVLLETGLIVGTLAAGSELGPSATMAGGVIGMALQALLLSSILFHGASRYRPVIHLRHEGLRRFGTLLFIRLLAITNSQIGLLVDRGIATLAEGEGNVTALGLSFKIAFFIPQILIWGVCEAVIAVFSNAWADRDIERIKHLLARVVRLLVFLAIPGAVFVASCSRPLVALLFERGAFTAEDTVRTALPLVFYACNLPFVLLNFLLFAVLWSVQENWSILRLTFIGLVITVAADVVFLNLLGYSGIALANLPRGIVLFWLCARLFNRRVAPLPLGGFLVSAARLLAAGAAAYLAARGLLGLLGPSGDLLGRLLRVAAGGAAVAAVYLAGCAAAAPGELANAREQLVTLVRRGRKIPGSGAGTDGSAEGAGNAAPQSVPGGDAVP